MQKDKKNLFLGIVLLVLVVIAYAYHLGQNQDREKQNNFISEINTEEINKIEVTTLGSSTVLLKRDEGWKIEGAKDFYLSSDLASKVEQGLKDLTLSEFELASENKEKKDIYHTDKKHGAEVKLYEGEEMTADFIVGRLDSPTLSHTYISRPDSDKTYLAQNIQLAGIFLRKDWRSKVIFDNSESEAQKLRFQYPDREFELVKEKKESGETAWGVAESEAHTLDQEKVGKIEELMTNLTAIQIPRQKFEGTGLEEHLIIVEAQGEGWTNTIMVGEKKGEEDMYYVKKGSSDNIYLISGEDKNLLETSLEELKIEE